MAKGKYAAKAANRAAAVDNEVIAELRSNLATALAENSALLAQLNTREAQHKGELLREVEQRSSAAIEVAQEAATAQVAEMQGRLDHAADMVAEFVRDWRDTLVAHYGAEAPVFSARGMGLDAEARPSSLLGVFRLLAPQRAGELAEICIHAGMPNRFGGESRMRRRRTAAHLEKDARRGDAQVKQKRLVGQFKSASGEV